MQPDDPHERPPLVELPTKGQATPNDKDWDQFVAASPFAHHEQTSYYGSLRRRAGFSLFRVCQQDSGSIVAGAQVLVRKVPLLGGLATVQQGPLLLAPDSAVAMEFSKLLDREAQRRRLTRLRVETHTGHELWAGALQAQGFSLCETWREPETCRIEVQQTDQQLLSQMTYSGRRGIRSAERFGIEVRIGAERDMARFHDLLVLTARHQQFPTFPAAYFDYLARLFPTDKLRLFLAYADGTPIAGVIATVSGESTAYGWGGMSREPKYEKSNAAYLLHWHVMRWARENGSRYYDLSGVSEFKRKLTKKVVNYPPVLEKFYGTLGPAKRRVFTFVWHDDWLRNKANAVQYRLYGQMPY